MAFVMVLRQGLYPALLLLTGSSGIAGLEKLRSKVKEIWKA